MCVYADVEAFNTLNSCQSKPLSVTIPAPQTAATPESSPPMSQPKPLNPNLLTPQA